MPFWTNAPGPFWNHMLQSFNPFKTHIPRILNTDISSNIHFDSNIILLNESHSDKIEDLLHNHYIIFPRSQCSLDLPTITQGFKDGGWIGVGYTTPNGYSLIGCVFSIPLRSLNLTSYDGSPSQTIENAGLVDFFCIHTNHRKKGIGSKMLERLVHETALQKRLVHIFQKEGTPLYGLPPIWTSQYIWRNRNRNISLQSSFLITLIESTSNIDIYELKYQDTSIQVAIQNLYHISIDGWSLGEVIWVKNNIKNTLFQQYAIESIINTSRYDVILMDKSIPHLNNNNNVWKSDSTYGYYIFNYDPCHYMTLKPEFIL